MDGRVIKFNDYVFFSGYGDFAPTNVTMGQEPVGRNDNVPRDG